MANGWLGCSIFHFRVTTVFATNDDLTCNAIEHASLKGSSSLALNGLLRSIFCIGIFGL